MMQITTHMLRLAGFPVKREGAQASLCEGTG
jgi:hypothetical protein